MISNEDINDFIAYLTLEKSLSENSIEAYKNDISKLKDFIETKYPLLNINRIELQHLKEFLEWIHKLGISAKSQARIISGIKSFFKFMIIDDRLSNDPSDLIQSPKIGRKLPSVLSIQEIDNIINCIDLSTDLGHRNRAIIETLYSCGLRVSELINLKLSNLYFDLGFIKVQGKGNKERLVPIGKRGIKEINQYIKHYRSKLNVNKNAGDVVFLNRRGNQLTRVMIFTIVKELAKEAHINKQVSPHTFRHSFATHLIDGGADLRAVQTMLGHESIITTEIYTHLDREYLRDAVLRFHPRS